MYAETVVRLYDPLKNITLVGVWRSHTYCHRHAKGRLIIMPTDIQFLTVLQQRHVWTSTEHFSYVFFSYHSFYTRPIWQTHLSLVQFIMVVMYALIRHGYIDSCQHGFWPGDGVYKLCSICAVRQVWLVRYGCTEKYAPSTALHECVLSYTT